MAKQSEHIIDRMRVIVESHAEMRRMLEILQPVWHTAPKNVAAEVEQVLKNAKAASDAICP